jgi:transcriptional regulator with XRE-family HTH domain
MPTRGFPPRARSNTPYFTLRAVAKSHGLTQEDIANRVGIDVKRVGKYETGATRIPSELLVKFLGAYGLTAEDAHWGLPTEAEDDEEPDLPRAAGL